VLQTSEASLFACWTVNTLGFYIEEDYVGLLHSPLSQAYITIWKECKYCITWDQGLGLEGSLVCFIRLWPCSQPSPVKLFVLGMVSPAKVSDFISDSTGQRHTCVRLFPHYHPFKGDRHWKILYFNACIPIYFFTNSCTGYRLHTSFYFLFDLLWYRLLFR